MLTGSAVPVPAFINTALFVPFPFVQFIVNWVSCKLLIEIFDACIGSIKVKPFNVDVPVDEVTLTSPLEPASTIALILEAELTLNDEAAIPPKETAVAPEKFVPVISTV